MRGHRDARLAHRDGTACCAYSPDDEYQCNILWGHEGDHAHEVDVMRWKQATSKEVAEYHTSGIGIVIGALVSDYVDFVVAAAWPQRDGDFDDEGKPLRSLPAPEVYLSERLEQNTELVNQPRDDDIPF